jgi:uncharacterized protein YdeI (YjbR/CyaY-like superfamily)
MVFQTFEQKGDPPTINKINTMNPRVDFYFDKEKKWHEEIRKLRTIILQCGLSEELKWGCPCYTWPTESGAKNKGANIVLIHVFKEYCAVLFFKGALLNDEKGILVQQTENVQSSRQVRFTNVKEINKVEAALRAYIYEAIEVEKAGLKVELKKPEEFKMAEEFRQKLDKAPKLKAAFEALTPGRQRAYLLYFSAPKQSKTRTERVEKYTKQILSGKGLND